LAVTAVSANTIASASAAVFAPTARLGVELRNFLRFGMNILPPFWLR
jgi:hypothetical protein